MRAILSCGVILLWLAPASSYAQAPAVDAPDDPRTDPQQEARALFEAGRIAYSSAHFDEALRNFEHAYELSERPELLFNIGLAQERLGDDESALHAFEEYLQQASTGENRAQVERRVIVLRQRIQARAADVDSHAQSQDKPSLAAWSVLASGGALVASGAVMLGVGVHRRGAVRDSADGTLEWNVAHSRLRSGRALSIAGSVALGVGAALALTSVVLFRHRGHGVTVASQGMGIRVAVEL